MFARLSSTSPLDSKITKKAPPKLEKWKDSKTVNDPHFHVHKKTVLDITLDLTITKKAPPNLSCSRIAKQPMINNSMFTSCEDDLCNYFYQGFQPRKKQACNTTNVGSKWT